MELSDCINKLVSIIIYNWKLMLILGTIFVLYYYYTATFDYFKKKGIPYMKPVVILGNMGPRITASRSFHEHTLDIYNHFKGKRYGGIFEGRKPILYIIDPELVKAVMIRDFDYFTDRNSFIFAEPRYMSRSLFNLKGEEWKGLRKTLTPIFSSSRLKNMLPLLQLCSKQMVEYLKQFDQKDVELKEALGYYTLEVIGACAFGIKCDAFTGGNSRFVKVAQKFDFMPKAKRLLIIFGHIFFPKLLKLLQVSFINLESTDELVHLLQAAKAERRSNDSQKKDLLQILVDIAMNEQSESGKSEIDLDDDTIDAQCLVFLIAGYDTSSTLLSFAAYVLATRPDLQDKLRKHVVDMTDGKEMSYELLSELDYLDAFLLETLRIYPPAAHVERVVTKPYDIPNSSVRLDIGDLIAVSFYGIHMDPEYYPQPNDFRPERFMGDEKKNRPSHLFLPFGAGPRSCIGLRFAMISAKIAMVSLLKNFNFTTCSKTEYPLTFDRTRAFSKLLKTRDGVWLRVETLNI